MYALFAICHALSPSRLDDNIINIAKDRYGDQIAKMSRGGTDNSEALAAFEELFTYACPKFISANPPPYDDPDALASILENPTSAQALEPVHRHLSLFLADVKAQACVPTLRSFLKLYTSLDARKLAGFLDSDEEEMVQQMMVMKQAGRCVSRVSGSQGEDVKDKTKATPPKGLLDGEVISTSDLNFIINEVSSFANCTNGIVH